MRPAAREGCTCRGRGGRVPGSEGGDTREGEERDQTCPNPVVAKRGVERGGVGLAAAGLAACGDDGESAQTIDFDGEGEEYHRPHEREPGEAEITLTNDGEKEADLQLLGSRGSTGQRGVADGGRGDRGQGHAEWFLAGGGVGVTRLEE